MKVFQNKKVFKKLIILFVLIIIVSFCIPKGVQASDDAGIGGVLLKPITTLFLTLGDGIVQIIHSVILQQGETLLIVDLSSDAADILKTVLTFVIVTVVVAAVVIVASEVVIAAAATAGVTLSTMGVGTVLLIAVGSGSVGGFMVHMDYLDDDIRLPIYRVSPEEIFANKIPTFDVDFFNPSDDLVEETTTTKEVTVDINILEKDKFPELESNYAFPGLNGCTKAGPENDDPYETTNYVWYDNDNILCLLSRHKNDNKRYFMWDFYRDEDKDGIPYAHEIKWSQREDETRQETKTVTDTTNTVKITSTAKELRSVISNWYIILRNLAIVILLSVLVYVGIRIIISSTSNDKAKYKQMLVDWVVAICLLFSMNYIMSFSNIIVEKVTDLLTSIDGPRYLVFVPETEQGSRVITELQREDNETYLQTYGIIPSGGSATDLLKEIDGKKYVEWNTNLMGTVRLAAQESKNQTLEYVGYMVMFIMLVLFTVYFVFTYLKRVIYMAFLTLVAPLVAMTYPIDKMNDGKAQAFDMWLKEYIFNLLIQPLHLLLYTILVSSAVEFAQKNMLYSLVAIAFMMPAEKLMRKFFGFEKAQTPGMLGGAAGAALAWSGVNKLMGHRPPKGKNNEKGKNSNENSEESNINFANNFDKEDAALDFADIRQNDSLLSPVENKVNEENLGSSNANNKINDDKKVNDNNNVLDSNKENNLSKNVVDPKIFRDSKYDSIPKDGFYSKYDSISKDDKWKKIKGVAKKYNAERKYYGKNVKNKMKKAVENSHPLRTAARIGAGALGAATFATAGGIVGLTSGDPSKAFQYATTGAVGGYNAFKNIPESVNSALSVDYTPAQKEAIERAKYDTDEEYEKHKKDKYVEQEKNDIDNIARIENKLGHEQAEKFRDGEYMDNYVDAGITDINDMLAAYSMEKGLDGKKEMSRDEAMMTVKYSKQIGSDTTKMKIDDKEKWTKTISSKLAKNQRAIENNLDTEKAAIRIINNVDRFNNIKNK